MKDRQSIRDVFNLNVVGNHIPLQSGWECFSKFTIGIDPKAVRRRGNENVRVHLAFRVEHARLNCDCFASLAHVIRNLPIQKANPVIPRNTKLCASREIEKGTFLYLKQRRHPSLDETGCLSSCRARRNSCVRKPRRAGIASLASPAPAEPTAGAVTEGGNDIWAKTGAASGAGAIASALACSSCSAS